MFTTPQDYYKLATDSYAAIPKTPDEFRALMEKMHGVYVTEAKKATEVIKTYKKAATGDASVNEVSAANKQAESLAVTARFTALMMIPGAIFMLPALSKIELELDAVDFIPDSVKREFNL